MLWREDAMLTFPCITIFFLQISTSLMLDEQMILRWPLRTRGSWRYVNSLRPRDALLRRGSWSTLTQVINKCCQLHPQEPISAKCKWKQNIFFQENVFKLSSAKWLPFCSDQRLTWNWLLLRYMHVYQSQIIPDLSSKCLRWMRFVEKQLPLFPCTYWPDGVRKRSLWPLLLTWINFNPSMDK